MRRYLAILAVMLPGLALAQAQVPFGGLEHDSSLPVEITADRLDLDQSAGSAVFAGQVKVGQGTLRLAADRVEVFYDESSTSPTGKVQRMIATGNVTLANGAEAAEADHAVYEVAAGTIAMDGNVLLTQGQNALSSERLDIDLNKGTGRLEGRVQTIFVPGTQPGAAARRPARRIAVNSRLENPRPDLRIAEAATGLEVHNLAKSYKGRPVLRDVSLSLRRGEVAALLGPNGAGKTTCFYAIAGLVPPDRGSILIDGEEVTWLPMYRRAKLGIGYLPQEASIFRGMTVADNIRAILEISVPDPDKRHAMLDELMGEFSITHLRRAPAIALSGGERRRVEIARCLAAQPNYVLLDEPFAGVDPLAVMDIRKLVRHLKDRGIGVLITDHNVRETLEIVDRAYILHDGTVLMTGTPEEVVRDDNVRRVYLGESFRI